MNFESARDYFYLSNFCWARSLFRWAHHTTIGHVKPRRHTAYIRTVLASCVGRVRRGGRGVPGRSALLWQLTQADCPE
jgi:hypothetical protein